MINTKFWSDNFIVDLNPLDRYLFLYFLTNEHTNISGIYELPIRTIAFETGIDKEMLEKMIPRYGEKIRYIDGWIVIKNFVKNQFPNKSIKIGIKSALDKVPPEILDKIKSIDRVVQGVDRVVHVTPQSESESESESKLKSKEDCEVNSQGKEIPEIIFLFKSVNPSIDKYYKNTTQRQAVERMLKTYGRENLEKMIAMLPDINSRQYWPKSVTPSQLENNIPIYKAKSDEDKNKSNNKSPKIGWMQ